MPETNPADEPTTPPADPAAAAAARLAYLRQPRERSLTREEFDELMEAEKTTPLFWDNAEYQWRERPPTWTEPWTARTVRDILSSAGTNKIGITDKDELKRRDRRTEMAQKVLEEIPADLVEECRRRIIESRKKKMHERFAAEDAELAADINAQIEVVKLARMMDGPEFEAEKVRVKEVLKARGLPTALTNEIKRVRKHIKQSNADARAAFNPKSVVSKDGRQTFNVQVGKYIVRELTDKLIGELASKRSAFYLGEPSYLSANESGPIFAPLSVPSLQVKVSEIAQTWVMKADGQTEVPLPEGLARQVLSMMNSTNLPVVKRMVNAPTPHYVGGKMYIIKAPGYHEASGFWVLDAAQFFPDIPEEPTEAEVLAALDELWLPFKEFPYSGPNYVAALIAALLTAVARPSLETSPAFIVIAPEQGSGKTLMGAAIGAFASGYEIAAKPFPKDDGEMRKVLLSNLRTSPSVIFFDNVRGALDSEPLAIIVTSPYFEDRLLGTNVALKVPTQTLVLLTGNNVELKGDMPRRALSIDIDPKMDDPTTRAFDLEPVSYVLANRERMWCAALTILKAHNNRGPRKDHARVASFEDWSKIILDCVNWLASISTIGIGDAAAIIKGNRDKDPERDLLKSFLEAARFITDGKPFAARDLMDLAYADPIGETPKHVRKKAEEKEWIDLAAASRLDAVAADESQFAQNITVDEFLTSHYVDTVKSLRDAIEDTNYSASGNKNIKFGWFLKKSTGRVVGKLVLRDTGRKSHSAVLWAIEEV